MKKVSDDTWTLKLRDDQCRALQLILNAARKDVTSFNKDWLPSQIAVRAVDELIDYFNDVCG